jgi:cephalosporin-C deacetylase-like acetyl esterase
MTPAADRQVDLASVLSVKSWSIVPAARVGLHRKLEFLHAHHRQTASELRIYAGRNPRPDDFDDYWAKALAELATVDPRPELKPAAFTTPGAECFDLWFHRRGGRSHLRKISPTAFPWSAPPLSSSFTVTPENSGEWFEKLGWPAAGRVIAAMDVRGQGGKSEGSRRCPRHDAPRSYHSRTRRS